jgi:hypothetical protein
VGFRIIFMSYHILHQFDEPQLAETSIAEAERAGRLFHPLARLSPETGSRFSVILLGRRVFWLLTLAGLIVAAAALFFALDARRRADDLQQRLTALERQK